MAAVITLDNFGVPKTESTETVIKTINDIAYDLRCNDEKYREMSGFFSDKNNVPYILTALSQRGGKYPAKNKPSYRPCWLCSWKDYCEWGDIWSFYLSAKILKKYPVLESSTKNCHILKEALVALAAEKADSINLYGLNSYEVKVVVDKISEYNSLNSALTCDDFLIDEQKREDAKAAKKKEDDAIKKQKNAYKDVTNTGADTKKYITYGAVGLAAIVFLVVLVKKLKK